MTNIRKHLCWLFGHRYHTIWFKRENDYGQVGITDTETGCVYCGKCKSNEFPIKANDIDWEETRPRRVPPKHNVYYPKED